MDPVVLKMVRFYLETADAGSFTKVANRLGVQISSFSRGVRLVDDVLRASVFERSSRGVELTDAGRRFSVVIRAISRRVLGEEGRYARTAFSGEQWPLGAPVELVVTIAAGRA